MEGKEQPNRNEKTEAYCNDVESYQRTLDAETQKKSQESEENHFNTVIHIAVYSDVEVMNREEKEQMDRNARNVQYGKELQQQMASRQQERQWKYEDSLIEHVKREEVSRIMEDEDRRELQRKQVNTQNQRDDMATSMQDRKTFKDKQKEMNVVEDRQIEQQRQSASDRTSSIIAEREHKLQMRDDHNQMIGAKTFSDKEARVKRDKITELLQVQEYLDKDAHDDQVEKEKSVRMSHDLQGALIDQIQTKRRDVLKQKEVDAEFQKQNEAIMAAGDEEEREKEMRVKEKSRQYSEDLRQQIEEKTERDHQHELEEAREHYVWDWDRDMSLGVSEKPSQAQGPPQAATRETFDLQALKNEAILAAGDEKEHEKEMRVKEKSRQYSEDLRQQIEEKTERDHQHELEEAREHYVWDWDRDMSLRVSENPSQALDPKHSGTRKTSDFPALKVRTDEGPKCEISGHRR